MSLALSLHAPNQALRAQIVPSARAYKLDKLMAAVDTYSERTGQKARPPTANIAVAGKPCLASSLMVSRCKHYMPVSLL